ncbi:MAG: hypothetical protein M3O36_16845 [Myxococcota bacterium]|nr:hypothetical protein [Myxococcota bacterium]
MTDPNFDPPSSSSSKSLPPPLPDSAARVSGSRAASDAAFAERMLERLAAGDYGGALLAAEALLVHQPGHGDALDCAQMARTEMRKLYVSRLGSLDRVPQLAMATQGLLALSLDFRAGLLLARIDGRSSIEQLVEHSGLPPIEALRILSELHLARAISFGP